MPSVLTFHQLTHTWVFVFRCFIYAHRDSCICVHVVEDHLMRLFNWESDTIENSILGSSCSELC